MKLILCLKSIYIVHNNKNPIKSCNSSQALYTHSQFWLTFVERKVDSVHKKTRDRETIGLIVGPTQVTFRILKWIMTLYQMSHYMRPSTRRTQTTLKHDSCIRWPYGLSDSIGAFSEFRCHAGTINKLMNWRIIWYADWRGL